MKKISSVKFEEILKKKYLSHFHTTYSDGASTVAEYFKFAAKQGVGILIFMEHVRREMAYEFDSFVRDIEGAKKIYPGVGSVIGVEAKILPGGELDIPEEILDKIQLIGFACHSFPDDVDLYQRSFERLFSEKRWKPYIRVWVHPGRFFKGEALSGQNKDVLKEVMDCASQNGVFIEKNLRSGNPMLKVNSVCSTQKVITGYDAHSVEEIAETYSV